MPGEPDGMRYLYSCGCVPGIREFLFYTGQPEVFTYSWDQRVNPSSTRRVKELTRIVRNFCAGVRIDFVFRVKSLPGVYPSPPPFGLILDSTVSRSFRLTQHRRSVCRVDCVFFL